MAVARPGPSVSPTANVADQQFEQLTAKGTEGVQRLRRNVQRIFDHLATGVTERVNAGMSNEKVYAKELKELLNEVLDEYEKIDKICQSLPNRNYPALLASRSFLAVNQSLLENRENYNQIICETEWLRKATEFSWFESNMLMTQGQAFRRFSRLSYRQRPGNGAVNAFSQPIFEQVFQSLQGFFKQQHAANPTQHPVDLRKLQSNGVSNCVLLIVKPVMQVVLVMRGVIIEFVNIKALHETFDTDDGNNICIKQMSAYPLFRELTGYMKSYFLGFTANITSNAQQINLNTLINSGRSQIMSLVQYRHLFNEPCGVCKRILRDRMPPIIREYRTTMPPNRLQPAPMHRTTNNQILTNHSLFQMSLVQYRHLFNEPCGVCKRILRDRMPPIIREYRTTMPPNRLQPAPMHRTTNNQILTNHSLFQMSLVQYRHLFNEPCGVCKRILRDRMPPIIREYRTTMPPNQPQPAPMHRACRGI